MFRLIYERFYVIIWVSGKRLVKGVIGMTEIQYKMNVAAVQNKSNVSLLPDGRIIFFGKGKRDNFCTYIGKPVWNPATFRYETMCGVVTDDYYFTICKAMADRYGVDAVYFKHLVGIYNAVLNVVDANVVAKIFELVKSFAVIDRDDAILAYMLIYYGMVSEENYGVTAGQVGAQRPICGKVIKMAGLYKHLVEDVPIGNPANPGACHCYVGMSPQLILQDAAKYGIHRDYVVYRM